MKKVKLYDLIGLSLEKDAVISLVGGGGKTTFIEILSEELKSKGKRVLVAPSTAMASPEVYKYDNLFIGNIAPDFTPEKGSITYFAEYIDSLKIRTRNIKLIENLRMREIFDYILIESDGAKGKPIKAPDHHEPVIIKGSEITLGIIGLDALGMPIDQAHVHRVEIFKSIIGRNTGLIDEDAIAQLVVDPVGLFKSSEGRRVLLLNKADSQQRINKGLEIKRRLEGEGMDIFLGEVKRGNFI